MQRGLPLEGVSPQFFNALAQLVQAHLADLEQIDNGGKGLKGSLQLKSISELEPPFGSSTDFASSSADPRQSVAELEETSTMAVTQKGKSKLKKGPKVKKSIARIGEPAEDLIPIVQDGLATSAANTRTSQSPATAQTQPMQIGAPSGITPGVSSARESLMDSANAATASDSHTPHSHGSHQVGAGLSVSFSASSLAQSSPKRVSLRQKILAPDMERQTSYGRTTTGRSTETGTSSGKAPKMSKVLTNKQLIKGGSAAQASWVPQDRLSNLVQHAGFEASFVVLIIINTFAIVMEVQYQGIDIGYNLGYPGSLTPAADTWAGAVVIFSTANIIFGVVFSIEVVIKCVALRLAFLSSGWNLFDAAIVIMWILGEFVGGFAAANPTVLRLCRLARILRILRLVAWIDAMDSLHVIVMSIRASMTVILWTFLFVSIMVTLASLVTTHFATPFLEDEGKSLQQRRKVYEYFGTFTRSGVSLFEVTFGNFGPVLRVLSENVDDSWAAFFIVYKFVCGFAFVSVINGVFLHETFSVANHDPDLMVITQQRKKQAHVVKMSRLFEAADRTGSGSLSFDDFQLILADPFIQTWLAAYELEVWDVAMLFELVDNGDGKLTATELLTGIHRLKGHARSMDLHQLMYEFSNFQVSFEELRTLCRGSPSMS